MVKKFTTKDFLLLYELGFSDVKIAKILNCSRSSVLIRRSRLVLTANYPNFCGKKSNPTQLKIFVKGINNRIRESRNIPTNKKKYIKYMREYFKRPDIRKKLNKYYKDRRRNENLQKNM